MRVGRWRMWDVRWAGHEIPYLSEMCTRYVDCFPPCVAFITSGVRIGAWRGTSGPLTVITCGYYSSHFSMRHADITTGFHAKPNWDADTTNGATHARWRPSTCMSSDVTLQDSFDGDMLSYSRTNERWADTRLLPMECGESSNEKGDKRGYMRQLAQYLPRRFE